MAVSRYWRMTGVSTGGNTGLSLSEARIYENGVLKDATATVTSAYPPTSGLLAYLYDDLTTGVVSWDYAVYSRPGFFLQWDFGEGGGVEFPQIRLGSGAHASTFPLDLILQSSTDGVVWVTPHEYYCAISIAWPGAATLTPAPGSTAAPQPWDLSYARTTVVVRADGADGATSTPNEAAIGYAVSLAGGAVISTAQPKFGSASIRLPTTGASVQVASGATYFPANMDFTVEFWYRPDALTAGRPIFTMWKTAGGYDVLSIRHSAAGFTLNVVGYALGLGGFSGSEVGGFLTAGFQSHVSLVRSVQDATLRLFVDGYAGAAISMPATSAFEIVPAEFRGTVGYLDDIRITRGVARYLARYSRPTMTCGYPPPAGGVIGTASYTPRYSRPSPFGMPFPGVDMPNGAASSHLREYAFFDAYHGGLGIIYGTTKTKGTPNQPAKARVVLLHQRSKLPVRETWSDPVTGNFAFTGIDTTQQFITLAEDAAGNFRPVAANRLTPEVLP